MTHDALTRLADQCVQCGLCLPHCPTYALDRNEAESPRGRILQLKALAENQLSATPVGLTHLDHCLSCRRCEQVCPAGVKYGELLTRGRDELHATRRDIGKAGLRYLAAHPRLLRWTWPALRIVKPLLPRALRQSLPPIPPHRRLAPRHAAHGVARGTVALFLGCAARRFEADALLAAISVLTRLGWDVHIPNNQTCCGALARHDGAGAAARQLEDANRAAFEGSGADFILTLDSGCFDSLTHLATGSRKVMELTTFLRQDSRFAAMPLRPSRQPVVLHLPCTQQTVSHGATAVRQLLRRIAGDNLHVIGETGCCGAAGTHMLWEPERAQRLRQPLLDAILSSGATCVVTGNVGCRMHLMAGLDPDTGMPKVRHPIEFIAAHWP